MIDSTWVNMTELSDSLRKVIPIIRSIEEHSAPAPFTYINIFISLIATLFGLGSFYYAKKTADNVSRLSKKTQITLFEDLLRDYLQIVVRQLVALKRLRDKNWYITEDAMNEIKYWPSEIYFKQDVYNSQSKIYKMIYNLKQRMQEYNNNITVYQQNISKGKRIGEDKVIQLFESNWMNLYKAYAIYAKLNCKVRADAVVETVEAIYIDLHNKYIKDMKSKNSLLSLDENLQQTYLNIIEKQYKELSLNVKSWNTICAIESRIKNYLCQDASLYEVSMRIKENRLSAK